MRSACLHASHDVIKALGRNHQHDRHRKRARQQCLPNTAFFMQYAQWRSVEGGHWHSIFCWAPCRVSHGFHEHPQNQRSERTTCILIPHYAPDTADYVMQSRSMGFQTKSMSCWIPNIRSLFWVHRHESSGSSISMNRVHTSQSTFRSWDNRPHLSNYQTSEVYD